MNTPTLKIRRLDQHHPQFDKQLDEALNRGADRDRTVEQQVGEIVEKVRSQGDRALLEYTRLFDKLEINSVTELEISPKLLDEILETIDPEQRAALQSAAQRIERFHQQQLQQSWQYQDEQGNILGQRLTPLQRVGVYVPGGKAAYPSSVLMNIIPAKVAGVAEVIMVSPTPAGERNELVLAAAAIAGADRLYTIGGAQAIAALGDFGF